MGLYDKRSRCDASTLHDSPYQLAGPNSSTNFLILVGCVVLIQPEPALYALGILVQVNFRNGVFAVACSCSLGIAHSRTISLVTPCRVIFVWIVGDYGKAAELCEELLQAFISVGLYMQVMTDRGLADKCKAHRNARMKGLQDHPLVSEWLIGDNISTSDLGGKLGQQTSPRRGCTHSSANFRSDGPESNLHRCSGSSKLRQVALLKPGRSFKNLLGHLCFRTNFGT
jgi:hypothetical protein